MTAQNKQRRAKREHEKCCAAAAMMLWAANLYVIRDRRKPLKSRLRKVKLYKAWLRYQLERA